ncbi:MAG: family 20 glycosylhydrolase, partial [Clostridia bacterium]|nr:family 20 glycosylhydrolase [Clostridia bacterium]
MERKIGVMLDCSRNMVMNVAGVKKFIDILAKIGYNRLMLYTEDTYEIKGEPMFGYMRGRYSGEEIKEIDSYALSKGIELVPCIQTLAHLNQLSRWLPYCWEIFDNESTLLVDDDRVYALIDKMFETCAENYTTKNIHIGMDEAHGMGLGKYFDKHGYEPRSEIFLRHLNKVYE